MPQLATFGASSSRSFGLLEEAGLGPPDNQFELVSLLLPGNGTNGAQNNTFLDSSTNNLSITRNGNTTQGTVSPFGFGIGTTQANGYYSGYFDGTGDYLTVPDNAAFTFGSGDFTVETWVYPNALSTTVVAGKYTSSPNTGWSFELNSTGYPLIWLVGTIVATSSVAVGVAQWNHIAVTRSGTALKIFVNGAQTAAATNSTNITTSGLALYINSSVGAPGTIGLNGLYSNLRIVKGTAVYTANFTVPTTPLTNITNTSLLTCQNSQFIDNSTNAFAITTVGNSQPLPTNPFGMTDWSGYFDGTGDYLTAPSVTGTTLDGDFTIEYFMYCPASGNNWMVTLGDALLSSGIETYIGTSGTAFNLYSANAVRITSSILPAVGAWSHVAVVRSGSTVTLYLNGVSLGTWVSSTTFSGITYIGAERYNGSITGVFTGFLSNVRIVKGTAVYTANFTPPTAPLTAISGTQLLTCQSSTFVDTSPNALTITTNGNPYTLTLNNPFNNPINYTTPPVQFWSNYFDGSGDYLSIPKNGALASPGDFTFEAWIYPTSTNTGTLCGFGVNQSNGYSALNWRITSTTMQTYWSTNGSSETLISGGTIVQNVWQHVAATRSGTTIRLFLNGTQVGTGTVSGALYTGSASTGGANSYTIGSYFSSSAAAVFFTGYITNFRYINGTALYTSNFTPPTAPLTAIINTSVLTCQSNNFVDNSIVNSLLTANGNVSIQAFSPFQPVAPYATTTNGGSGYFDGTGDSLTYNSTVPLGSGDFTLEVWVYLTATPSVNGWVYGARSGSNTSGYLFFASDRRVGFQGDTTAFLTSSIAATLNTWNHIAVIRQGTATGNLRLYLNGIQVATTSTTNNFSYTGTQYIGATNGANPYNITGYISGLRIVVGTAVYVSSFATPVSPTTNISNTSLLLNYTNAGIYDVTSKNVLETVGNAQISTAQSKWSGSSMYFDGSGDYLSVPPGLQLYLSGAQTAATNKNFTIECWIYSTTLSYPTSFAAIAVKRGSTGSASGYILTVNSSGALSYAAGDSNTSSYDVSFSSSNGAIAANNWYHVAVTRQGTTFRMFINGTQVATASPAAFVIAYDITGPLLIGLNAGESPAYPWYGYMQDFRYTIGVARYTANFTPPTAAFPLY
jgi:hypothetical protein